MEQPVVFALTPQGGHWNHRFLVPGQTGVSQSELLALAERARRGGADDIICVTREVQQVFNGRPGVELLVIMDARLSSAAESVKAKINVQLQSYQEQLDGLIQEIDWDRDGRQLIVERSELTAWRDELLGLISGRAGSGPPQTPVPSTPASEPPTSSPLTSSNRISSRTNQWTVAMLGCVTAVLLMWWLLPLSEASRSEPSDELITLANEIGIQSAGEDRLKLLIAIEARMRTVVFAGLPGANESSSSPIDSMATADTEHAEDRLVLLLQRVNAEIHPQLDQLHGTLTGLLNDLQLRDSLRRLFPGGQFDRRGLLAVNGDQPILQQLAECCDYRVVVHLVEAVQESETAAVGNDSPQADLAKLIGKLLSYLPQRSLRSQSMSPMRRFYLDQDAEIINAMAEWLAAIRHDPTLQELNLIDARFDTELRLDEFFCRIGRHARAKNTTSSGRQTKREQSQAPASESTSALSRFVHACESCDCSQ